MRHQRYIDRTRLVLGFLLAPAILPICSLVVIFAIASTREIDCPAGLGMLVLGILSGGTLASYGIAAVVGLPYVLWMENRGELGFWSIMAPIVGLIVPFFVLLFVVAAMACPPLGVLAVVPLPGIILSALCFYLVAVWRPGIIRSR
jgi:hypothetical protein